MKSRRRIRYPGLCRAAKQFGVHRNHLYLVLRGDRVSHRLLRQWQAFTRSQKEARA